MVKAVLLDLDGTVVAPDGRLASGVAEMVARIRSRGLRIAVLSGKFESHIAQRLRNTGLDPELVVGWDTVCAGKRSPKYIQYVCDYFGLEKKELVYIGDSDDSDAICASNAKLLYLHARWSVPNHKYGIPVYKPADVASFIETFLLREPQWYWELDDGSLSVRCMIDGNGAGDPTMKKAIIAVLKQGMDPCIGGRKVRQFLLLYFLTTITLADLQASVDWWVTYPGHEIGATPPATVQGFLDFATKLFHERYKADLVVRHTTASKSAYARSSGATPTFANQVQTVILNAKHQRLLEGKRVIVIDDFCTDGKSFECARNLLTLGGAEQVSCLSIGKYGPSYIRYTPTDGVTWDPYTPSTLDDSDFDLSSLYGTQDPSALEAFLRTWRVYAGL